MNKEKIGSNISASEMTLSEIRKSTLLTSPFFGPWKWNFTSNAWSPFHVGVCALGRGSCVAASWPFHRRSGCSNRWSILGSDKISRKFCWRLAAARWLRSIEPVSIETIDSAVQRQCYTTLWNYNHAAAYLQVYYSVGAIAIATLKNEVAVEISGV